MRTYAVRRGLIPRGKVALFARLRADFEAMPDLDPADVVSCHAVCRALAMRHPVRFVDGCFMEVGSDHSWIDMGDGVVADMYPIGGVTPFMVDASHWMVPWNRLYIEKPDLLDHGNRDRARHDQVALLLVAALEEIDRQV